MFSRVKFLSQFSPYITQKAGFQNYVMSDALAQLESECEKCCYRRVRPAKVTILGAGSDIGRIAALCLKQESVVKTLALYDDEPDRYVLGVATDVAHIDTSTEVEAYQGRSSLPHALHDAAVVLICGGCYKVPPCCYVHDRQLFCKNMQFVRNSTIAVAQFCPHAIVALQTPPVDCNFALCAHTLKPLRKYDRRRLLGVNAVNAMRANQLFSAMMGADPLKSKIAVVGGTGRCTRVPVFSGGKPNPTDCNVPNDSLSGMSRLVREADDIICRVKSNNEQGHLSIGFATARFVANIMKGLYVAPTQLDSALVEQEDPAKSYGMPICATPVTVGPMGIQSYNVPALSEHEREMLAKAKCDLEDMLNLGKCYATGDIDEYTMHPCKFECPTPSSPEAETKQGN